MINNGIAPKPPKRKKVSISSMAPLKSKEPINVSPQPVKKKWDAWFLLPFFCFVLMGILLFDVKIFLMGDDADYIFDSYNFVHKGLYPVGRSSLYSMSLGIPVFIFGTNVVALKCFSFLCAILGFVFLYRSFYSKVPNWMLYSVLVFSATNSALQVFSSSNLSEAFFMMVQYGYIATVFLLLRNLEQAKKGNGSYWLFVGFMGLAISLSKNIALIAPFGLTVFFLIKKEWRNSLISIAAFLMFKIPYEILLRLLINQNTVVSQWGQVMAKDLYHHEKGMETFGGFINRFIANVQIYYANFTLAEFGVKIGKEMSFFASVVFVALLLWACYRSFKKNKFVFFTSIYVGIMCIGTFLALQPPVAQGRIIFIYAPLLLLLLLFALHDLLSYFNKYTTAVSISVLGIFLLVLFLTNLQKTFAKVQEHQSILIENLGGDIYFGYTTDWINYLQMGKWVKENIPDHVNVAARKPNSLSIYSEGRPYVGIYSFPTHLNADQLLMKFKKDGIQYLVVASLRANPARYIRGRYISTIRSHIVKIEQSYKGTFTVVHHIGKEEACYLVKINYPKHIK